MPALERSVDLGRLAPGLRTTCQQYLDLHRRVLADRAACAGGGAEIARTLAKSLDGLLGSLACAADAAWQATARQGPGRVALVAVGGFGRGMVAPHSDIDVLFLCDSPADPAVAAHADAILYPLWDLGLSIGHAVRGVGETLELARHDVRTATTLLDLRRLAGDREIVDELARGGRRSVFQPRLVEFLDALQQDTDKRHERFGGSLYLLEPEIKLGCGGLRDFDVLKWAARARWACTNGEEYVRTGALLARELAELERARDHLWRVRNLLHLHAGRRHDRLTFADQEDVADELGYEDDSTLAVEQFMQDHYRHAGAIARATEHMLARARPAPRRKASIQRLGDGTMVFGGQITLEHSELLGDEPAVALRLYRQVRRRKLAPYAYARDHIARVAQDPRWACRVREDPEAVQLFCDLLSAAGEPHPGRRTLMADLHDVGLLLAMVPEFAPIVGRVEHDLYHVYTADVHAVAAVEYLRRLVRGDHKSELPLACRLAAEAPRRLPIFLALLTHGLGKPYGTDVGVKSAAVARPIALRLGLSPADADHVAWLVERQLEFYHWAVRRDTVDPEALADVAQAVQSPERLRDLYLFTVALVASTNPTAMTSWKACMLEELYRGVSGAFDSARPSTVHGRVAAVKKRLAAAVADGDERARVSAFVAGMPDRYMLANPVDTIRAHASIEAARGRRLMHVGWAAGPGEDVSEVVVVSEDRPRLLADVAAALAAQRLSVMSAQIHTRRMGGGDREAFDVFHVCRPGGGLVDDGLIAKLVHDLEQLKCDHVSSAELLARVPRRPAWALRRVPEVETNVLVDNASSSRFTIVDVFTRDRLGLLHVIARALHEDGLSIALSKVSTEGLRAADVFYVVDGSGAKIEGDGRLAAIANRVRVAVEAYHRSVGEGGHG